MRFDDLFVNIDDLPDTLNDNEVVILFENLKKGDQSARAKLVEHNIKLVIYLVNRKYGSAWPDKKELVSIGNLGLLKAVDTYDLNKGYSFSAYASKCISNEILMFLRKDKKNLNIESLDNVFSDNNEGDKNCIIDFITDNYNIDDEYINNELKSFIKKLVYSLPDKDREIIMLYYGFYNNKIYTQKEIAKLLNITQSYVSRIIAKNIYYLSCILEYYGYIEGSKKKLIKSYI